MLTRLYVNNYKCLVNFEWKPGALALLTGPNGSGKTSVMGSLDLLRLFVSGEGKTDTLFVEDDLTRWAGDAAQSFELGVTGSGGTYAYRLVTEVDKGRDRSRAVAESLHFDGKPLFEMADGTAQLYRDDFSAGPRFPFDWTRSGVGSLHPRHENQKLMWFRDYMSRLLVVKVNPFAWESESDGEAERPDSSTANFASWYRYLSQERQGDLAALFASLGEVLDGFQSLNLPKTGEKRRALRASFRGASNGKPLEYGVHELSEGQRALLVLYTMLTLCVRSGSTVCIDEPDNFVAPREIQPWLVQLKEKCLDGDGQVLLISHHPEIIDYLAGSFGYWLDRAPNTPARIRALGDEEGELRISELMARGWIHE